MEQEIEFSIEKSAFRLAKRNATYKALHAKYLDIQIKGLL